MNCDGLPRDPVVTAYIASLKPDPIYRDSAMALSALPGSEQLSWMADLLTIKSLKQTMGGPSCPR